MVASAALRWIGMTKTERIEQLERQVKELVARIEMLEARPIVPWYVPREPVTPWPKPTYPPVPIWTGDNTGTHPPWYPPGYTVCGADTVYPADILPGTVGERIERPNPSRAVWASSDLQWFD